MQESPYRFFRRPAQSDYASSDSAGPRTEWSYRLSGRQRGSNDLQICSRMHTHIDMHVHVDSSLCVWLDPRVLSGLIVRHDLRGRV